ncbi:hypothetical protein FKM82_016032 [Ascaphus truei]
MTSSGRLDITGSVSNAVALTLSTLKGRTFYTAGQSISITRPTKETGLQQGEGLSRLLKGATPPRIKAMFSAQTDPESCMAERKEPVRTESLHH